MKKEKKQMIRRMISTYYTDRCDDNAYNLGYADGLLTAIDVVCDDEDEDDG